MKKNPYEKNIMKKCFICNSNVYVDQYGNGSCSNCGWEQGGDAFDFPNKVRYPNLISLNKAKHLFRQNKSFIPALEDFIEGLLFYSEMRFEYRGRCFGVLLRTKELIIEFFENRKEESSQFYKTKEDFMANAHIDGVLLKNIWYRVQNADYM